MKTKNNTQTKSTLAAVMGAFALAVSSSHAAIVAFEAESGTLGSEFDPPLADAGALGGFYITTETDNGGSTPGSDAFTVSYSISVAADTYDVYVRARIGDGNPNDDSFYYAKSFADADPTASGDWHLGNGLSSTGIPVGSTGPFGWGKMAGTVTSGAGGTVQWEIGAREDGFDMDAFALVTTGQVVTDAELDAAVTIPEPSAAALLGLGGLALILRRRK